MYVADMYIKVTQYDKMQRASAGHKFVLFRSVLVFGILFNCVCIFI